VDRSFGWFDRTTTFRADLLPTNKQRDVRWSAGLIQELTEHVLIEAWYTDSSDPGGDASAVVKADFVIRF
jgi:hypothetical protein